MKEKQGMKQNKKKGNELQILQIKTRSRVVLCIWKSGKGGQHSQAHWVLALSSVCPRGIITWCRWADNALHAIRYEVHMSRQADVCACLKERDKETLSTTGKNPSWESSPLVIQIRRTIFLNKRQKQQVTDFSTQFSRYFKVFTMHLHNADSKLENTVTRFLSRSHGTENTQLFRHNEANGPSGSLKMPEWEFYKTEITDRNICGFVSSNSFCVLNVSMLCSYPATV